MMLGGGVDGKTGVQHIDTTEYTKISKFTVREYLVLMDVRIGEKEKLKKAFKPRKKS